MIFTSEVKWIKITTDMFEDDKIDYIQTLPEADAIIVIWVRLLTLAGKCNAGGYIYLTENIPYDPNMLASKFRKPITTVNMALEVFRKLKMIESDDNGFFLCNWDKHQNIDGLEKIKEQNRKRVQNYRKKQKMLKECNVTCNATGNDEVTQSNAIDIDKEEEIEIDIDKELEINNKVPFNDILEAYNEICCSLPKVKSLSSGRKDKIKTRWKEIKTLDKFKDIFIRAEKSSFLTGNNNKNWKCSFDWLIKNDGNYLKVLEGKYDNKPKDIIQPKASNEFDFRGL